MMRLVGPYALGLTACALMFCQQAPQREKQDIGSLTGNIVRSQPGEPNPFIPILTVRLCSTDRVLQTESDKRAIFRFVNVPAGQYDLEAGREEWGVFRIKNIAIEGARAKSVIVSMDKPEANESVCFLNGGGCKPTGFSVQYGPRGPGKSGIILGQIINLENGRKGLPKASVSLFQAGDTKALSMLLTDKQGLFHADLQPGIYDLTMSRKGFQDVKISHFLVPLENETDLRIETRRVGAIVVCQ